MVGAEKNGTKMKKIMTVQKWNWVTCTLVFLFMLYLNISVRYCTDDWHFKFVFYGFMPDAGIRRMRTFQDVMLSAMNYYRLSGGRVLAHGLTFCVLMLDQWLFDVVNAGMFVALGLLAHLLVPDRRWRTHAFSLPLIFFGIIYFSFSFGDSVLWLSGSVNYLWAAVLNLFAVFLFQKYTLEQPCKLPQLLLIAFLMFLAGQSNETTGGMLLILLTLQGLFCWKEKKLHWRPYAVAAFFILCGMAVVLLAPGNRNRASAIHNMDKFDIQAAFIGVIYFTGELLRQTWPILLLCLFVFLLQARKGNLLRALYSRRFFWAGAAGTAALGIAGVAIPRATFLPVVYLIIAGCEAVEFLLQKNAEITEKGRWEEMLEKRRFTGTMFRLTGALLCLEILYFLSILLLWGLKFSAEDIRFLLTGAGLLALSVILPILPNKKILFDRLRYYGRIMWIPCVVLFVILYFFRTMTVFEENKAKQWEFEEQVRIAANAGKGQVLVGFPLYQDSELWPLESSVSQEYTWAWMQEYFQLEENGYE